MKKIFDKTTAVFLAFCAIELFLQSDKAAKSNYTIGFMFIMQAAYLAKLIWTLKRPTDANREKTAAFGDILFLLFSIVLLWELFTAKLGLWNKMLYPVPGAVIHLFFDDMPALLKGLASSARLLIGGYIMALAAAVPLGLIAGWRKRFYLAAKPLTKVLGPVPPMVYIPYAIAILPSFRAASIFVIFIGSFWPIFINTLNGVFDIDKKIIDSARAIHVNEFDMLLHVILPGSIPSIMSGATIGLSFSFILLTSAEMIGATSGMGWYVKYFSDFADYPRVIVGIVFIGIVVSGITHFFEKLEKYLLRWRKT
jgi:NitT/TauT family transport system permease protein